MRLIALQGEAMTSLAAKPFRCPACGPSLLIRLCADETRVRCLRCRATPVHLSVIAAIRTFAPKLGSFAACELSSRGALADFLRKHCRSLALSEYLDDVEPGAEAGGIRCEDVQALTYPDGAFDLSTSTEVFEHVPDDMAGFRELHRTLKPSGLAVFTVPMASEGRTVERARLTADGIQHLLEPAYHGDRLRGAAKVLVYRDYAPDIRDRLTEAGFSRAILWRPPGDYFGHSRIVVVATA